VAFASFGLLAATAMAIVQGEDVPAIVMTAIPAAICVAVWRFVAWFEDRH
jgi:mannose/fructose/N-acetylgalactosamine-specific phosphotransferase system component IIC